MNIGAFQTSDMSFYPYIKSYDKFSAVFWHKTLALVALRVFVVSAQLTVISATNKTTIFVSYRN